MKDLNKEIEEYINNNFTEGCDGAMISDRHKSLGGIDYMDLTDIAHYFVKWKGMQVKEKIKPYLEELYNKWKISISDIEVIEELIKN